MRPAAATAPTDEAPPVSDAPLGAGAADLRVAAPPPRRKPWVPIVAYLVTVFVLLTFNFALPRMMPGDPIDALLAFGSPDYVADDETRAKLAEYYGLDKSIPEQYARYLGGLVRGDLGVSTISNVSVGRELGDRAGWSLLLIASATLVSLLIGIPAGIHSGWKRGKRVDRGMLAFFLSVQNIPIFVVAFLALLLLSAKLQIFPLGGATDPTRDYGGLAEVLDIARHAALPALLMGFEFAT
ncbi:MAG TPA: ABC transporter permease, partial [Acidimicrobiales bacterium]|nr:ABC transporter permease [Acidimicrobiales bacterium]